MAAVSGVLKGVRLLQMLALTALMASARTLVTCPGFPGYCSEAYPGGVCTVVCAFGRNNVPECQPDGTWSDVPRCIEHEPGIEEQRPGLCPGVPGYCSDSGTGYLCEFDCISGPDIRSVCTKDGTWDPYPVCSGDVRETRDGCDGCPGPFGGPRNRTAEGGAAKRPRTGAKRPPAAAPPPRQQPRPQPPPPPSTPNRKPPAAPAAASATRAAPNNNRAANRPNGKKNKNGQGAPIKANGSKGGGSGSSNRVEVSNNEASGCSPELLEDCIGACPARVFGACAAGCAKRC